MLLRFKVSNYLSFNKEVEFSLQASSIKENVESNTFLSINDLILLKGGVLYGANSAGKSNLIKSINFVQELVLNSNNNLNSNDLLGVKYFKLSSASIKKPSSFIIEFEAGGNLYKYGVVLDEKTIHKEYLFEILKTKEKILFERDREGIILYNEFSEYQELIQLTRTNALFISVAAQFNVQKALQIIKWFKDIVFLYDKDFNRYTAHTAGIIEDSKRKKKIIRMLSHANLGFENVRTEHFNIDENLLSSFSVEIRRMILNERMDSVKIMTTHPKYDHLGNKVGDVEMSLTSEESLGTQKYFALAGYILDSLENGKVVFIDELDARLHPLLSILIVRLYNSAISNPKNAQMIFSTHNTNLLSGKILRRDQIVLVNKNKFGESELNTLHQLKIRNDASFEKEYLEGEYDAVPFKTIPEQLNLFD